ncbi:MAG: mannose-1-phosphate guanylyltransferase [Candidatus Delongbacteria bacterium]|nr:MAG: mannose-1-phosphate guanylyltransferase [Candidatus Delongbacteria bacterium]
MDETKVKSLLVFEDEKFIGLLTIGDIQRALIKNISTDTLVKEIIGKNKVYVSVKDDIEFIKSKMSSIRAECMPVLSDLGELIDVYFWKDLFGNKKNNLSPDINIPVVIMAGGKGTRMRPITNIIPKPLIPLDDKTIAEHIISNFLNIGCNNFFMSVNYKSKTIRDYFDGLEKKYTINFFEENKPLGTAGSLHLLDDKIKDTFFISNCDILIEEDYREIYKYHREYNNELTIVGSFRHYSIPYGTLETCEEGQLTSITEKPELSYLINSGMYILEPHLIRDIPKDKFFHITDLIKNIQDRGGRVGVFPVSEKSWIDIGEWDKYLNYLKLK